MKVALIHDYLKEYGGAERVLETLHEIFPEAPVYVAYLDLKGLGPHAERIKKWDIRTSWIQNLPWAGKLISPLRILAPAAFESFDLKQYDLVISSCAVYFAKAVITRPDALHISYIHTPPRYLYGYTTSYNYKKHFLTKVFGELANYFLRIWDYQTSQRPDVLVANSENVRARIKKFYRRDTEVIYPPVDMEEVKNQMSKIKSSSQNSKNYYLSLGRLVRGKGVEIIVEACSRLNLPLKVAGTGPELENLKKIAGRTIEFLGEVKDSEKTGLCAQAMATIVASEDEDFGIVPVESMAAGTPVIAPHAGGFLETVTEKTGLFYPKVTVEDLIAALNSFYYQKYQVTDCYKQAAKFSKEEFVKKMKKLIEIQVPRQEMGDK